jgi:hypothetical protein
MEADMAKADVEKPKADLEEPRERSRRPMGGREAQRKMAAAKAQLAVAI